MMLLVLLVAAAVAALLLYNTRVTLRYWSARGVPHAKPLPFIGNFAPILFRRATGLQWMQSLSRPFASAGYCGAFMWSKPILLVWHPELAKQVLTKDFHSFHDRGRAYDPVNDPLSAHLFNLEGERWRRLRNKLSPTFTSGKLKLMLPLMTDVCKGLSDVLLGATKSGGGVTEINIDDLMTRYAADVIGTCAFGIECNSLHKKDDPTLTMVKETLRTNVWTHARIFLKMIHPQLCRLIPLRWMFSRANDFFLTLMRTTVEHRETNRIDREDFVGIMMQLRKSDRDEPDPENRIDFNNTLMTAQAYIFFVAGLDGISNTVAFCLHQLAFNADLQRRAVDEIRAAKLKHGSQLSYESLQDMELVDRILREGLRLWTPMGILVRKCTGTTKLGDVVVEKGQLVMVCSELMHRDPTLFRDPTRFDPDRFLESQRHPYAFLPFGEGPRNCIAERFAMLEMKLALVSVLSQFQVLPSSRTGKVPQGVIGSFQPIPKDGIWVNLRLRGLEANGGPTRERFLGSS